MTDTAGRGAAAVLLNTVCAATTSNTEHLGGPLALLWPGRKFFELLASVQAADKGCSAHSTVACELNDIC